MLLIVSQDHVCSVSLRLCLRMYQVFVIIVTIVAFTIIGFISLQEDEQHCNEDCYAGVAATIAFVVALIWAVVFIPLAYCTKVYYNYAHEEVSSP